MALAILAANFCSLKGTRSHSVEDRILVSRPPTASNDPILSWVWSFIASIEMGRDKIETANEPKKVPN